MNYIIPPLPDTFEATRSALKKDPLRIAAGSRARIAAMDKRHQKIITAPFAVDKFDKLQS